MSVKAKVRGSFLLLSFQICVVQREKTLKGISKNLKTKIISSLLLSGEGTSKKLKGSLRGRTCFKTLNVILTSKINKTVFTKSVLSYFEKQHGSMGLISSVSTKDMQSSTLGENT